MDLRYNLRRLRRVLLSYLSPKWWKESYKNYRLRLELSGDTINRRGRATYLLLDFVPDYKLSNLLYRWAKRL